MIKTARVKILALADPLYNSGVSSCVLGTLTTLELQGVVDPDFGDDEIRALGEFVETDCIPVNSEAYQYRSNYCPYGLCGFWLTNVELMRVQPGHVIWVDEQWKEEAMSATIPMTGNGGVDIPTLALYAGNYQGGWYATFDILQFNSSLISANFQSNPTQYSFGSYSYQYHGYTVGESSIDMRKTYLPLRTWFPTLEPGGMPQDTNVWVPVPTWERSTGVKWHLHPSVTGVCKVYWMKLWSGFDAYF